MNADKLDAPTSADPAVEKYARHVNPAFVKLLGLFGYGRLLEKARDVWIWDQRGTRYLDALAGFGAVNVGHNHPRLKERLKKFLDEDALNFVHVGPSAPAAELAERLATLAGEPLSVCLFSNTGAEAVEGGIKIARAATGRRGIVSCTGAFHGMSLGTLSIGGEDATRSAVGPLLEGCERVPFGDLAALERVLAKKQVAAFVVDPFQCELEAVPPPPGYLKGAFELCERFGTTLVLDEVQTGVGRTGTLFAYQAEGFVPHVLCLAKSLSGGIAPIGATLVSRDLHERACGSIDRFNLHASTFGGNSFSCAAALETLAIVADESLVPRSRERGQLLRSKLEARLSGHPLVRGVRGRGLLVSIDLGPTERDWASKLAPGIVAGVARTMFGQWAAVRLLERGLICQPATQRWNVLKLEPPLTIAETEVETIVSHVAEVLGEYPGVAGVVRDVTARLGKQFLAGWAF